MTVFRVLEKKGRRNQMLYVHDGLDNIAEWPLACGDFVSPPDLALADTIGKEFRERHNVNDPGMWGSIVGMSSEFTTALAQGDLITASTLLDRLFATSLPYGFEQHGENYLTFQSPENHGHPRRLAFDRLLALAEAFGVIPLQNAEQGNFEPYLQLEPDVLLDLIEQKLGVGILAPLVVPGLYGLKTRRGIFTDRTLTALYVAYRIRHDLGATSVCEIGGGMGYVAYWLSRFGTKNIVICDLPMVSAVQRYFLSKNGVTEVDLVGIEEFENRRFDLVVNVDSLPEIGGEIQRRYIRRIASYKTKFLSINQEACASRSDGGHQERVMDIAAEIGGLERVSRAPFFMRRGYVEELYLSAGHK